MAKLQFTLPEDYKPLPPSRKDKFAEVWTDNGVNYWIYTEKGKSINYINATPQEVIDWALENIPITSKFADLIFRYSEEDLELAVDRAAYLSIICKAMFSERNGLFPVNAEELGYVEATTDSETKNKKEAGKKGG